MDGPWRISTAMETPRSPEKRIKDSSGTKVVCRWSPSEATLAVDQSDTVYLSKTLRMPQPLLSATVGTENGGFSMDMILGRTRVSCSVPDGSVFVGLVGLA